MKYITLEKIVQDLDIKVVYKAENFSEIKIYSTEINRPGLQMYGYYGKFAPGRLQIIGNAEWHYIEGLSHELRYQQLNTFFSHPIPALIFSRDLPIFPEALELAEKHNINILKVTKPTSMLINDLISHIGYELAPSTTLHGVFMEVYGIGVLLTGKSGVGKSETALDLVIKGHRLVADDAVEIKKVDDQLRGECPELTKYFMEIRGIGILDIERLYGIGAVKPHEYIDLVVELELWDDQKNYDRIGLDEETITILDVNVPKVLVPVRTGRNVAMIVEVAARNNRQKRLGYNAAHVFNERIMKVIEERKNSHNNK